MLEQIFFSGAGGQGIILMGKLVAYVAVRNTPHVTFFPAYGAEVRGGTSNCQVVLAETEIASPVCNDFSSMLIMNRLSAQRFADRLQPGGLLVLNTSLCGDPPPDTKAACVPATDLANELGNPRAANFIMLGAFLTRKPLVEPEEMEAIIGRTFAAKGQAMVELNLRAFRLGQSQV